MLNKFLLFIVQLLLFAQLAFSASLYCDYTNGNDANDCTNGTTQLCKTLQRCVNVATGGDTINIANTSAQILTAEISWASGWTADNTKHTTFQAWNNGGSITIQRPDEPSARVGGTIDGNGAVQKPFSDSSHPDKVIFRNLKFTGSTIWLLRLYGGGSGIYGCEFYGSTFLGINFEANSQALINSYFHNIVSSSANPTIKINRTIVDSNFFEDNTPNSGQGIIQATEGYSRIRNNIIKMSSTSDVGIFIINSIVEVVGNTFTSDGSASIVGIKTSNSISDTAIYNSMFYNFDGASSKPIDYGTSNSVGVLGYNAYFDCNANGTPSTIGIDLTANDITGTGDPFVDSANDDYSVTGSTAEDAGLGNP